MDTGTSLLLAGSAEFPRTPRDLSQSMKKTSTIHCMKIRWATSRNLRAKAEAKSPSQSWMACPEGCSKKTTLCLCKKKKTKLGNT